MEASQKENPLPWFRQRVLGNRVVIFWSRVLLASQLPRAAWHANDGSHGDERRGVDECY
jgi:hypothetical protein